MQGANSCVYKRKRTRSANLHNSFPWEKRKSRANLKQRGGGERETSNKAKLTRQFVSFEGEIRKGEKEKRGRGEGGITGNPLMVGAWTEFTIRRKRGRREVLPLHSYYGFFCPFFEALRQLGEKNLIASLFFSLEGEMIWNLRGPIKKREREAATAFLSVGIVSSRLLCPVPETFQFSRFLFCFPSSFFLSAASLRNDFQHFLELLIFQDDAC